MAENVIVLAGPTASGKTVLSLALAEKLNGEIVSADSMQVYRGMDIGTAKLLPADRQGIPHHMIDVASPDRNYSVACYVEEADLCCKDILSRGRIPVITGGTGLYIDSLLAGRNFADADEDDTLRADIEAEFDAAGADRMLQCLAEFDPERASKLAAGDRRRIVRAIEIYRRTGITATEHDNLSRTVSPRYNAAYIVLSWQDREALYSRINARVDQMVQNGLFDEVSLLLSEGLSTDCTSMQAIGYKEAAAALRGNISKEEAVELIKLRSRRYAKRQLTWFRRREDALWIFCDDPCSPSPLESALSFIHSKFDCEKSF